MITPQHERLILCRKDVQNACLARMYQEAVAHLQAGLIFCPKLLKNTVLLRLVWNTTVFTFAKKLLMIYQFNCTCSKCAYFKAGIQFGANTAGGVRKTPVLNKISKNVDSIVLEEQIAGLGDTIIPYTSRRLKGIFSFFRKGECFVDWQNKINEHYNLCPRCATYNLSFIPASFPGGGTGTT